MPNQIVTASSNAGGLYDLGNTSNAVGYVAGGIRVTAGGFYGSGTNQTLLIEGRLESYGTSNTLNMVGAAALVAIGRDGVVSNLSRVQTATVYLGGDGNVVQNEGRILGAMGIYLGFGTGLIDNSGSIIAYGRGAALFPTTAIYLAGFEGGLARVSNSGLIQATPSVDMPAFAHTRLAVYQGNTHAAANVEIDNTGTINGSILLNSGVGALRNAGMITGSVDMGAGNDLVYNTGEILRNLLLGAGNDTLRGGQGMVDGAIYGGLGNDSIVAGSGLDYLSGGDGNDVLRGGSGDDTLDGQSGNDLMIAGDGNDYLVDGIGYDTVRGGSGDDTFVAGLGTDSLYGGAGADVFLFQSTAAAGIGASRDVIRDFQRGVDVINLATIDARTNVAGNNSFAFIGAAGFSGVSGQLRMSGGVIYGDLNGDRSADFAISVSGITTLSAADFVL